MKRRTYSRFRGPSPAILRPNTHRAHCVIYEYGNLAEIPIARISLQPLPVLDEMTGVMISRAFIAARR